MAIDYKKKYLKYKKKYIHKQKLLGGAWYNIFNKTTQESDLLDEPFELSDDEHQGNMWDANMWDDYFGGDDDDEEISTDGSCPSEPTTPKGEGADSGSGGGGCIIM